MPSFKKSIRNVLDADANATTVNAGAFLYTDKAESLNASDQLFIISDTATRRYEYYVQQFGFSQELAGNFITASIRDSLGSYPAPSSSFFAAGVQIDFMTPQNFPVPFPLSSYGQQGGIVTNIGLRHYHHQIQYGLHLDGNKYVGQGGFLTVDYMSTNYANNISAAGDGTGTWDTTDISMRNLAGVNKPVTALSGNTNAGAGWNILLGDPLGTQTGTIFEAGATTGYFTDDGVDEQLCSSTTQEISMGGYSDGF